MQYIILNGKTPQHKFKDGVGAKTWEEAKDFDDVAVIVPKGYIVLDFDTPSDAEIMLNLVETLDLKCRVMRTTRGVHCWFKTDEEAPKCFTKSRLAVGIYCDRKSGGRNAYVKIKQDGKRREWIRKVPHDQIETVPKWLSPVSAPTNKFSFKGMGDGDGRNQELFNYIIYLQTKGFKRDEIKETIQVINNFVFAEPLPDNEISLICRDEAFKSEGEFVSDTNESGYFRHNVFAEEIFKEHKLINVNNVIYEYIDGYYQKCEYLDKYIRIKKPNIKNNQKNEVLSYIKDMKKMRFCDIKRNPYIINLKNTRLDIRNDTRLEFTPDAIEFDRIPVTYDPSAYCSDVDNMLNRVFCGDTELISLFYEMVGYILLKELPYETAFIFYGDGANGKSTILDMLKMFIGSANYSAIPLDKLSHRFSTAELENKLVNIGDDINNIAIKDNGTIKQLISGKTIQVERKGERPFDLVSYATLIFSCNDIPKSYDTSAGYYRRWIFIPFNARFTNSDKDYDPLIKEKITTPQALSYILNKALEGYKRLRTNKRFTEPKSVNELKSRYKIDNSPVLSWLSENDISREMLLNKPLPVLFSDFQSWCKLSNINHYITRQAFYKELRKRFDFDTKPKRSSGKEYFKSRSD